jgi:hypothetical protein
MFMLHSRGGSPTAGPDVADARLHELHHERPSAGPLDGELLDLYAAIVIIVPLALFLKLLLF